MFKFNHFNFNVLDLDRSLKFYKDALGLEPVREKTRRTAAIRSSSSATVRPPSALS